MPSLNQEETPKKTKNPYRKGHSRRQSRHSIPSDELNSNSSKSLNNDRISRTIENSLQKETNSDNKIKKLSKTKSNPTNPKSEEDPSQICQSFDESNIITPSKYLFPLSKDYSPNEGLFQTDMNEKNPHDLWNPTVPMAYLSRSLQGLTISKINETEQKFPLSSVHAYVEIGEGMFSMEIVTEQLRLLGATVHASLQMTEENPVSHAVLYDCSQETLKKISSAQVPIVCVSPKWVLACYSSKYLVDEEMYLVDPQDILQTKCLQTDDSELLNPLDPFTDTQMIQDPSDAFFFDTQAENLEPFVNGSPDSHYFNADSFLDQTLSDDYEFGLITCSDSNDSSMSNDAQRENNPETISQISLSPTADLFSSFKITTDLEMTHLESAKKKYLAYKPLIGSPLKKKVSLIDF